MPAPDGCGSRTRPSTLNVWKALTPMELSEWLEPGVVVHRLGADSRRQALAAIADIAARRFGLDASEILDALMAREAAGSTGVGQGVAVPHAELAGLTAMRAVFVRLETPVEFDAVDDQPVDLLLALFAPKDAGASHLRALARVSRLMRDKALRTQLRQAESADALHALLVQRASASAA